MKRLARMTVDLSEALNAKLRASDRLRSAAKLVATLQAVASEKSPPEVREALSIAQDDLARRARDFTQAHHALVAAWAAEPKDGP